MISKMIHDMASWVVSAFLLWGAWRNCPICLGILQNCYENPKKTCQTFHENSKISHNFKNKEDSGGNYKKGQELQSSQSLQN